MNQKLKKFLNEFELYLGTICFMLMTIFLFMQVLTRYAFNYALSWTEEISIILFVWMVYLGTSAAVLKRKHLKIDFVLNIMPPKIKKVMMIVSNCLFILFCGYIIAPLMKIVQKFVKSGASTSIIHVPKSLVYIIIPVCLGLTIIRLVQECFILYKEDIDTVGEVKGSLDLDKITSEIEAKKRQDENDKR